MSMKEYEEFRNLKYGSSSNGVANNNATPTTRQTDNGPNIPVDFNEINYQRRRQEREARNAVNQVLKDKQAKRREKFKRVSTEVLAGIAAGALLGTALFGSAHLGYLHRQKQAEKNKVNVESQMPDYDLEDETEDILDDEFELGE